jgi:hypothetical protein
VSDQKNKTKTYDWSAMVRAQEGKGPHYYPTYQFRGRTFKKRDTSNKT